MHLRKWSLKIKNYLKICSALDLLKMSKISKKCLISFENDLKIFGLWPNSSLLKHKISHCGEILVSINVFASWNKINSQIFKILSNVMQSICRPKKTEIFKIANKFSKIFRENFTVLFNDKFHKKKGKTQHQHSFFSHATPF